MNAEPSSAPNNHSQQHLMNDETVSGRSPITGRQKITVVILCFVNLINYMDRYTIAGNENYFYLQSCNPVGNESLKMDFPQ